MLSAEPTAVIFSSPLRREIIWYAGPWPIVERWWARRRRRAHLQMVLASGEALLSLPKRAGGGSLESMTDGDLRRTARTLGL